MILPLCNKMNLERKREYIISDSTDIQVEIEPVEFDDMANQQPAESSVEIRKRVMAAREIKQARFKDLLGIYIIGGKKVVVK